MAQRLYSRSVIANPKRPTEAYHSASLFKLGLGHVTVARFKPSGETEVGVFLIDAYCLGVKDAFFTRVWEEEYDRAFLDRLFAEEGRLGLSPACARKLITDAVAYAGNLGFAPDPDYKRACRVLGGIDPSQCDQTFTFGQEGKPLYIQGPHDSPARVREILERLRTRCGEGNYHFMVLADSMSGLRLPRADQGSPPPPK